MKPSLKKLPKLLIISGPTATGKTALAVKLAQKFNGQLISADSRQIYRGMDVGTGKDHPTNTPIHLVDIINPNQLFSAAQYHQLALNIIHQVWQANKLPIIVGGTGQYIDAIINPQPTFVVPPNHILRFFLNRFPLSFLQLILKTLDFKTFNSLNHSDSSNPHRLIRKIEINISNKISRSPSILQGRGMGGGFDVLHISLTAPNQFLYQRIDQRVDQRLKQGLFDEIKILIRKYHWSDPGLNCLAYKEFKTGFTQKNVDTWRFHEHSLARRQKTWFKAQPNINFIDITKPNFEPQIIALISNFISPLLQGGKTGGF